jgi:hypothetical protein
MMVNILVHSISQACLLFQPVEPNMKVQDRFTWLQGGVVEAGQGFFHRIELMELLLEGCDYLVESAEARTSCRARGLRRG